MRVVAAGLVLAAFALGQSFENLLEKAPPGIDNALRARVNFFYQAHVDGKFRLADQAVHEDSKDIFFAADKTKFEAFKIVSIAYHDNFTKAKVVVDGTDYFLFPGVGRTKVNRPVATFWKQDGGQWWWYVDPDLKCKESPLWCQNGTGAAPANASPGGVPDIDHKLGVGAKELLNQIGSSVKASKTQISLDSLVPSSDEIIFTNQFETPVTLQLDAPDVVGLEAKLDMNKIAVGQAAKLKVSYKPRNTAWKTELSATIRVQETSQTIPVRIVFALPPKEQPKQ
jgi:hypothetical protein